MNTQYNRTDSTAEIYVKKNNERCFSWSAIVAGTLVGLGISFLLNLFAAAIGLTAFTTSATSTATLTFAIGGFLGLLVVSIISMGVLGWVAGYLGALKISCNNEGIHCNYGCLYGFTAWSLALILSIFLSAHVGNFLSYTVAALANPAVAVEKYPTSQNTNFKTPVKDNAMAASTTVNSEEAKKTLAISSFVAFVLFFVGAFFSSLAGHIAFERCIKKHGKRIE